MTPAERIIKLRNSLDMQQNELAEAIHMSPVTLNKIEKGRRPIKDEEFVIFANFFNTTTDYILRGENPVPPAPSKGIKIPILGAVVAGVPVSAVTDIIGYEEITPQMAAQGNHFALKIKGDSMFPKFENGDIVVVREQHDVDSGDVAIVLINGDEATCKKLKKMNDGIMLYGYNPSVYPPHFYSSEEVQKLPVVIIGKVIELRRSL
jgi:repressor LexA